MDGAPPEGDTGSSSISIPGPADFIGALALLTNLPLPAADIRQPSFGRVATLFPLVGAILGCVLAAVDHFAVGVLPPLVAAVLVVVIWELLVYRRGDATTGRTPPLLTAVFAVVKILALWSIPAPRFLPLLFAPLLGRWSMVVLAVGARDAGVPGRKLAPAVMFNEFALASLFTFGVVFGIADGIGVLVAVQAAALTLGLRVGAHVKAGGISWSSAVVGAELIEVTTLMLLAGLATDV